MASRWRASQRDERLDYRRSYSGAEVRARTSHTHIHPNRLSTHKTTHAQNPQHLPLITALYHLPPLFGCRNPKHPDQLTSYQVDRVFGPTAQQAEIFDAEVRVLLLPFDECVPPPSLHAKIRQGSCVRKCTTPHHVSRAPQHFLCSLQRSWARLLMARTRPSLRTDRQGRARYAHLHCRHHRLCLHPFPCLVDERKVSGSLAVFDLNAYAHSECELTSCQSSLDIQTHTMQGTKEDPGVIPRAVETLLKHVKTDKAGGEWTDHKVRKLA